MPDTIRIGTRDSQLAVWQATRVSELLAQHGHVSELVYIKSEGDLNLTTPLYEIGVQGIFTRTLDIALLENRIDIAVHSMKDVPVVLPKGLVQMAVLKRASYKDLLVLNEQWVTDHPEAAAWLTTVQQGQQLPPENLLIAIATSSVRRKAQWLHRFPATRMDTLRGNVNTRLRKVAESNWTGAIFAAAGLERIGVRPSTAIELDWMLPAPAQGAIMVAGRMEDYKLAATCKLLNDEATAVCVKAERDFLKTLMGGCTAPISALAKLEEDTVYLEGSLLSVDGKREISVQRSAALHLSYSVGVDAALEILDNGGDQLMKTIRAGE